MWINGMDASNGDNGRAYQDHPQVKCKRLWRIRVDNLVDDSTSLKDTMSMPFTWPRMDDNLHGLPRLDMQLPPYCTR
jgi:hypothetical protein